MIIITRNTAIFIAVFIQLGLHSPHAMSQTATSKEAADEQVRIEIAEQANKLRKESRNGDTSQFSDMVADDLAVFDPNFPFLLDPPKEINVELEKYWDAFDKEPPTNRPHKIQKIQVFGNVALLTMTAMAKGTPVDPGFMSQAKFLSVYEKRNGKWMLVYTHDGRRMSPNGLSID